MLKSRTCAKVLFNPVQETYALFTHASSVYFFPGRFIPKPYSVKVDPIYPINARTRGSAVCVPFVLCFIPHHCLRTNYLFDISNLTRVHSSIDQFPPNLSHHLSSTRTSSGGLTCRNWWYFCRVATRASCKTVRWLYVPCSGDIWRYSGIRVDTTFENRLCISSMGTSCRRCTSSISQGFIKLRIGYIFSTRPLTPEFCSWR